MKDYVVINHNDGAASAATAQEWGVYFEAIKNSVVDGGKPITKLQASASNGDVVKESDTVVGYYIIKAHTLDEAIELVKGNPLADKPGCKVRLYETMQM